MTVKQAAKMLGVSVDTLRRWDREGRLPPSGRTLSGWRYYLFTDIQTILDNLAFRYQKSILQKTAAAITDEAIQALSATQAPSAAHHIPLRTRSAAHWNGRHGNADRSKTSLTEKAQQLLDAVNAEDYIMAIDVLMAISDTLKNPQK